MQPGAELLDDTRRNAVDEDAGRRLVWIDSVVAGRDEVEVGAVARVLERERAAGCEEAVVEPLIMALEELAVEAVGWYGVPFTELRNWDITIEPVGGGYVDDAAPRYFNNRKSTIYGGSSEVQRNIMAKAMLGF